MSSSSRVYLFDTTLRDGAQTQGVDFTVADKAAIARELDRLGIDYIEGGWPGANPTDDRFFADPPGFANSKFVAFGMTRRAGRSAANDPGLNALLQTKARTVCMVGKTWDFHVDVALELDRNEYVDMIGDSIAHAKTRMDEVMFDAEHFFDGYKANPDYALACLKAAATQRTAPGGVATAALARAIGSPAPASRARRTPEAFCGAGAGSPRRVSDDEIVIRCLLLVWQRSALRALPRSKL